MRNELISHYKVLLELGWLVSDSDGFVSVKLGDETMPATVGGKRLILPTVEQMKDTNWSNRIGFHPLRESYNLGISDVLACLRDQYVQRLNTSISYFMKELIDISFNKENQKNLTIEQAEVLNVLSKCDKVTVRQFESILKKTKSRNDASQFINIFIKRAGTVNNVAYGRAAIVTLPIYDDLISNKDTINGIKLSQKDRDMFRRLYEFVFPSLRLGKEPFNVGINTRTAPFLECLVKSVIKVAQELVEVSAPYKELLDLPSILDFPEGITEWIDIFDSKDRAERYAKLVPALNSNEDGEVKHERKEIKEMPTREEVREVKKDTKPRGIMTMGYPPPQQNGSTKEISHTYQVPSHGAVQFNSEYDRLQEEKRKIREKEEELRRKEEELERRSRQDRDYDRNDRRYDERDDGRRRDPEPRKRTGDPFEDNPVLRGYAREEDRYDRGGRYRDRERYDHRRGDDGGRRDDRRYGSRY